MATKKPSSIKKLEGFFYYLKLNESISDNKLIYLNHTSIKYHL